MYIYPDALRAKAKLWLWELLQEVLLDLHSIFAIPTHQFLFSSGSVNRRFYMDDLQLEESEFALIQFPQQGVCFYKCGNERYLLEVHAPEHKEKLFGKAGGRGMWQPAEAV